MEVTLVYPHQLFENHPALQAGRPVHLIEDTLFFGNDPHWPLNFHKKKLILHRASMKSYEQQLCKQGFEIFYHKQPSEHRTLPGFFPVAPSKLHLCDPVDDVLSRRLRHYCQEYGIELKIYESPNFLSPRNWLDEWFNGRKKPFMATFYKAQRTRMNLLVEKDGSPRGGKWSFDEDNRKKLPRKQIIPEPPSCEKNKYIEEAIESIGQDFPKAQGLSKPFQYPVDRSSAQTWLRQFFEERFHLFGDYEDAISSKHRVIFHGVLTPVLNIGLLNPDEIISEALAFADEQNIPLNTVEGFIRQIIGWREFMRAMYGKHGIEERTGNFWNFTRKMPASFYDGTTGIAPIDEIIHRVLDDAYCHHIERLMVLGNFMLLCRIHPTEVYRWFMELFIDAYDWVMVPNVYGMSQFADGGIFTTKPYLSGSNYILKMSDYKRGPWCEVWDGLFWTFIDDHQDFFLKNHRLSRMAHMLKRMDAEKHQTHRRNAEEFLAQL